MKTSAYKSISILTAIVIVAGFGFVAPPASAQCFGPDGLDVGPCCAPVIPNLPNFPGAQLPALGICWNSCTLAGTQDVRVDWSPPSQIFCGQYISQFTVSDAGTGFPILSGLLTLDYTRTWLEDDPSGVPVQVWRFVAKIDLSAVAGVPPGTCTTPSCISPIGPHPTAYYYGYVDYASCSTAAGSWEQSMVLYHACDRFIHTPGLSNRPGVFHPGGSYALVAPHSAAQPFVPSDVMASSGALTAEATRTIDTSTPPPNFCIVEDKVVNGSITKIGAGCICTLTKNPKHQTFRDYKGQTACVGPAGVPGGWNTLFVLFPTLPWVHLVSTSIGSWTGAGSYPGTERAWADEGLFLVSDVCTGDFVEIKYGASTRGGYPISPGQALTLNFTDLADNFTAPLSGPFPSPAFGTVQPTDHLVYTNN